MNLSRRYQSRDRAAQKRTNPKSVASLLFLYFAGDGYLDCSDSNLAAWSANVLSPTASLARYAHTKHPHSESSTPLIKTGNENCDRLAQTLASNYCCWLSFGLYGCLAELLVLVSECFADVQKLPPLRGLSTFIGILVSPGSTAAVSNAVAGVILIYRRAFQVGDRIKVAEVDGVVEDKLFLVTRIRTDRNEIVTLPNALLLSGQIVN